MGGEAELRSPTLAPGWALLAQLFVPEPPPAACLTLGPLLAGHEGLLNIGASLVTGGQFLVGLGLEPEWPRLVCELGVPQWGMLQERPGGLSLSSVTSHLCPPTVWVIPVW